MPFPIPIPITKKKKKKKTTTNVFCQPLLTATIKSSDTINAASHSQPPPPTH